MEDWRMISWYDGGIADILPGILKDDPAVQALSYAVRQEIGRASCRERVL